VRVCYAAQDPSKRHILDRKLVREVVCALCCTRQPTAPKCAGCGAMFGLYTCMKCNLFDDDDSKQQFHCEACTICRCDDCQSRMHD
jgi:RING finger and CHY zinc finger domain-containing protein 1